MRSQPSNETEEEGGKTEPVQKAPEVFGTLVH